MIQGNANQISFGPIVEVVKGPVSLTLDPLFTKQRGDFADQEALGFQYGWQLKYELTSRWALALEMFGEIDDLANAGSFNDQNHSLGPTLYYTFGGDTNKESGRNTDEEKSGDVSERRAPQLNLGAGIQLGLTDATSDVALKLAAELDF